MKPTKGKLTYPYKYRQRTSMKNIIVYCSTNYGQGKNHLKLTRICNVD